MQEDSVADPILRHGGHLAAVGRHQTSSKDIDAIWVSQDLATQIVEVEDEAIEIESVSDHTVVETILQLHAVGATGPEWRLARHARKRIRWTDEVDPDTLADDDVQDEFAGDDSDEADEE